MKRLIGTPELLDGHQHDESSLAGNLQDLRRSNRFTGGADLSRRAIDALVPPPKSLTVLDVGTGAADIPVALVAEGRRRDQQVQVTAVDSQAEVIEAARAVNPDLGDNPEVVLAVADGRRLPYSDRSFDVAHASLVLHHLDPADAVAFLSELARVSRRGVVVNDLSRRPVTVLGAWLLSHLLTMNRYSRNDATISARRAYTVNEAYRLLDMAGLEPVFLTRGIAGHRWAIAAVRADA